MDIFSVSCCLHRLLDTFRSLATSAEVTGCIAALWDRNLDAASCRNFSKLDTSLKTRRHQGGPAASRGRKRADGGTPEERPGELHPALLSGHLERQRDRLLPAGPHTQPQPPAEDSQSACSRGRGLQQLTHLQRISALRQALRSYTSCIFITWVRGRGSWRTGSSGDLLKTWTLGRSYLLQEQRQELHQLVRGQRLHVGLREGAQIRLLRLTEGWRTLVQL